MENFQMKCLDLFLKKLRENFTENFSGRISDKNMQDFLKESSEDFLKDSFDKFLRERVEEILKEVIKLSDEILRAISETMHARFSKSCFLRISWKKPL